MKKTGTLVLAALLSLSMLALAGCSPESSDPGAPPEEVINPGISETTGTEDPGASDSANSGVQAGGSATEENPGAQPDGNAAYEGELLEGAMSVRIGRDSQAEFNMDMYNNDAATTMLDYLSGSALLFPAYTYDEEQGFVGQSVRGNYTRDNEVTVADVHTGEVYLFSGGQLRLYFKDAEGANITATPVGYFTDTENLTQAVQEAYESNLNDTWGVDVYFWITKTLE